MKIRYYIILCFSLIIALNGCGASEEENTMNVAKLAAAKEEIAKLKLQIKEENAHLERIELEMRQIKVRMEEMSQIKKQDTKLREQGLNETDTSNSKTTRYHEVQRGDTISEIAKEYGITIQELCRLNEITPRTIIRPGEMLIVRAGN